MENQNTFHIGLCMAGAVSAGAYTAGVVDYLIEALQEWQLRKDNHSPNTPSHAVKIPVIGGASAGGMTGIIAAAALQDPIEPIRQLGGNILEPQPGNALYRSWVDLLGPDMLSHLLDTADMRSPEGLQSLLNADFIDEIAQSATQVSPAPALPRPYLARHLKLFVTLSNLNGMEFSVNFKANSANLNRYQVRSHNDYACFKLCNSADDYANDGWIPLNFKTKLNAELAIQAAKATGAFPLGLKARRLSRDKRYMNELEWLFQITQKAKNPFQEQPYTTVNVDGGMINNEPFDKIKELLAKETGQSPEQAQNYTTFNSTVLMVDPFPGEPGDFDAGTGLFTILGNTLSALLAQAGIKTDTLIDAMDSDKAGQFMIVPTRQPQPGQGAGAIEGKRAIACGALGGFSGFISKEFRVHDYFLGRANCEIFLRDHFTVPANCGNPIFVNGYAGISDTSPFRSRTDGGLQIIPIFTERRAEAYMPVFSNGTTWPTVRPEALRGYRRQIKARVQKTMFLAADFSPLQRLLLWIGAKVVLNGKIADGILRGAQSSLREHGLLR